MWAYVRRDDPWRKRSRVSVEELLGRTVVGVPTSFTAREALEAAVSTIGGSFTEFIEAANGTIAQALAAAGRGVAVVSDDPRYDLVPIAIGLHDAALTIQLVAAWDTRKVSAPAMAALAGRLADWVAEARHGMTARMTPELHALGRRRPRLRDFWPWRLPRIA